MNTPSPLQRVLDALEKSTAEMLSFNFMVSVVELRKELTQVIKELYDDGHIYNVSETSYNDTISFSLQFDDEGEWLDVSVNVNSLPVNQFRTVEEGDSTQYRGISIADEIEESLAALLPTAPSAILGH